MQRVLNVLFRNGSSAAHGTQTESSMSTPSHARNFSTVLLSSMAQSRRSSIGTGSLSGVCCSRQPLGLLAREYSTAAESSPGAVTGCQNQGNSGGHASEVGVEMTERSGDRPDCSEDSGPASSATPASTCHETPAVNWHQPVPQQLNWPDEKRRWTWAEKRAARIEREKVVDKQLKKKWKVARKNRRGRQRSARRHLGIERPFVALDV